MQVFMGIDWGHSHHDLCFMNASGQVLSQLTVEHTAAGLAQLEQARVQLGVSREDCRIGLETAHTLVCLCQSKTDPLVTRNRTHLGPLNNKVLLEIRPTC